MPDIFPTIVSIAGSDSIGGAGIQADVKTAYAFGVYAATAVTALTAQNTLGVERVEPTTEEMVKAQLRAISDDITPGAVKTGMLPTAACVRTVAGFIKDTGWENLVVDPVMLSTSGATLAKKETKEIFLNELMPLARIITPNLGEASAFTGITINSRETMQTSALILQQTTGCRAVLLKGGHFLENSGLHADFFLSETGEGFWFEHPHIPTPNTHGTGCSLSSAIAALLSKGKSLPEAVKLGIEWLQGAIGSGAAVRIWKGHGPVNHFYRL